ncbi:polysaccharide deacetylase family protein [Jinshanibacter sp. LJY008]|uniref:Polysaccharide deacetylase family protein n=1 Tax=Limnobaculum eriocheiris TaxID=2897391 RepID=A0A9X1MWQ2_9GAMM|nr:polysaccharide deacetylase family protein [Limnobaculum eriocheiris]MCD1126023.1 polysaccharide deacetylase family protein [Limnobaculum eriocheiris]
MKKLILLIGLLSFNLMAAGPQSMAVIDRSQLSDAEITDSASFDRASQLEILAFAKALLESESIPESQLPETLSLPAKRIDIKSMNKIRQSFWQRLAKSYRLASTSSAQSIERRVIEDLTVDKFRQLVQQANVSPVRMAFHRTYVVEQLRLAALFPKTSSEISTFSDNEVTGESFADRQFVLTFDDGPSPENGSTVQLIDTLNRHQLHAYFFVLGESFQRRLQQQSKEQLMDLYQGQCVGSHGWQHKSHASWADWQNSVLESLNLISKTIPNSYALSFRPPYGQRRADSGAFFRQYQIPVVLWNIDSQDWSQKVSTQQASDRVLTLMLLWRKGIILFHDVHTKAPASVDYLYTLMSNAGVTWQDCRRGEMTKIQ